MKSYILKRVLVTIPLVFLSLTINFIIMKSAPGDPVGFLISGMEAWGISPDYIEMIRLEYGLNKPISEQLLIYMGKALSGDLGYSYTYHQPVLKVIFDSTMNTLLLMSTGFSIALILGVLSGISCSKKAYSKIDNINTLVSLLFWSMPSFWFGTMALLIFSLRFNIFPVGGITGIDLQGMDKLFSRVHHLALPAITIGLAQYAVYSRFTRASMLEVLSKDYIKTAWSKGCTPRQVYYKHAFRNALLPIVTIIGLRIRRLFMGSVLIETVFAWPGLGSLLYFAITARDYNLLMAIFLIYSIITIISTIIVDISYAYLDPRIRYK